MTNYQIDETQRKTRKSWRLCMLVQAMFPIVIIGLISLGAIFTATWQVFNNEFFYSIFQVLFALPFWFLLYHCAYKKHGNVYLTLCLIFSPIKMLGDLNQTSPTDEIETIISLFFRFLEFVLFIWWFYLSIKLRNINKKISRQIVCFSDAYSKAVPILQEAVNVEDLNNKFAAIVRESPEITWVLNEIYKEKKAVLDG